MPLIRSKVRIPPTGSMPRERLEQLADEVWRHRLTIVAAPAGSGKTTLLAAWAAAGRAGGRHVGWYRAESMDAALPVFLAYVQLAICEALAADPSATTRGGGQAWHSVEDVAAWLERRKVGPLALIIDDCHYLAGSAAEAGLARLLDLAPPDFAVVLGTRCVPTMDVSRWRLPEELLELGGDDLRFRSWEVEQLFRDHYREVLRGDELARLARRTEGWAAGLQFFHLATTGKSPAERARLLESLPGSTRLIRQYLVRNVLDELPDALRQFLVSTCLLRRLSGPLCDRFLGASGSESRLEELERRQVFTASLGDGTYRYHEVLQANLEQLLAETEGEAAVRRLAARAATLLEAEGALAEAILAYCRAERWDEAERLLGSDGHRLDPRGSAGWLAEVAPALIRNDPWLRLASARRLRAEGRWESSVEAFEHAETGFGASEAGAKCRAERLALVALLDPDARSPAHWSSILRAGLRRDPTGIRSSASTTPVEGRRDAPELLTRGLLDLAAGRVRTAELTLLDVSDDEQAEPAIAAAALIAAGVAGALGGKMAVRNRLERGMTLAERAGESWLGRLGRGALALLASDAAPESLARIGTFRLAAEREGDAWGVILFALIEGWAGLMCARTRDPEQVSALLLPLEEAAAAARRLGAGVLEAWAWALVARARAQLGDPTAQETAVQAERMARAAGVRGAFVPVYLALAASDPERAAAHLGLAEAIGRETGLEIPAGLAGQEEATPSRTCSEWAPRKRDLASPDTEDDGRGTDPPLQVQLLGGFVMRIGGRCVNLAAIKPRHRAILRLLALSAGRPVHREVLAETFWPDTDPLTASRNVQVAISGLRRELGRLDGGESPLLVRDGDAYRLAIPPGAWIDLAVIEDALAAARTARARMDSEAEASAFRLAIDLGTGELLPEDGPAEWVMYRREELRRELAGAARALAESIGMDDPEAAAEVCTTGLRLDPHDDSLWRLLIETHERAGDQAAAETARQGYARMLVQLGVAAGEALT